MDLFLFWAYVLILAAQIVLLIFAVRKPEKNLWARLFCLEFLSVAAAVGLMFLFDALPGRGMAPGLTWFGEFFYSFYAAIGYGLMILISIITAGVLVWRKK